MFVQNQKAHIINMSCENRCIIGLLTSCNMWCENESSMHYIINVLNCGVGQPNAFSIDGQIFQQINVGWSQTEAFICCTWDKNLFWMFLIAEWMCNILLCLIIICLCVSLLQGLHYLFYVPAVEVLTFGKSKQFK